MNICLNSVIKNDRKIRLLRVITDDRVVPWHLGKTLKSMSDDFEVTVVGLGVTIHNRTYPNIRFIDLPIYPKINLLKDTIALFKLIKIICRLRPDVCHSIMPKAGLLCALASHFIVPVRIHTFTGQVWQTKKGVGRFLLRMSDKFIIRLNTICFTDSASQSQFLLGEGIVFKGNPLPVILKGSLGGVDLSKLALEKKDLWRSKVKNDLSINNNHLVVGYLARKTPDKGALLILEAFSRILKRIPNVTLLFIGPDDSDGALDAYKSAYPNWSRNVIEMNEVSNHEEYLAVFDVLCLPSYREGFGSIVIDAAALSIPCVGSRIPGLVDAIEDTVTGLLFNCGDIDDLSEKLFTLLQDSFLLQSYGISALSRVKHYYDSEVISRALEDKYKELLVLEKHF